MLNTIVHLLDSLEFGEAETGFVGDIVDATGGFRVFTVDTTDLELQTITDGFEVGLGRDLGELDMDGGANGGAEIGGAEGEPTETVIAGEGDLGFDGFDSLDEAFKDLSDVAAVLHAGKC